MNPDFESRAKTIFLAALDLTDPADRFKHIVTQSAGDPELIARIGKLIDGYEAARHNPVLAEWEEAAIAPPTIEGYADFERIGAGGFGVVYKAQQLIPRRQVAIKVLKPRPGGLTEGAKARFRDEICLLATLKGHHICTVYAGGICGTPVGQTLWYAMEFIDGASLHDSLQTDPLDHWHSRLQVWYKVCDATAWLHSQKILHNDLKPSNVLLGGTTRFNQIWLVDFGIARTIAPNSDVSIGPSSPGLTSLPTVECPSEIAGTVGYAPPERSQNHYSVAGDVYSLGAMLRELATGRSPGSNSASAIPKDRPKVVTHLARAIAKALAPDPAHRFQSVPELVVAVRAAVEADHDQHWDTIFPGYSQLKHVKLDNRWTFQESATFIALIIMVLVLLRVLLFH